MSVTSDILFEDDLQDNVSAKQEKSNEVATKETTNKNEVVWFNAIGVGLLHVGALYGIYLIFTSAKIATTIFAIILEQLTMIGITAGNHRLWAHRSYKAKWPLRLILLVLQTTSLQFSVIQWVKNHRLHHKYSDTNADPHNSKRGFFFSHAGWYICRKNAEAREKQREIDVSDLYADPILRFQNKYFEPLTAFACLVVPPMIAVYGWNESWSNAFFITAALRYAVTLNLASLVGSVSHMNLGDQPYERKILPTENKIVSILTSGEGWHNYHHAFPWDYKAAESGNYSYNLTAAFIDFFAWIGWAYDLKAASKDMIQKKAQRTGDGSHEVWGWNNYYSPKQM